MLIPSIDLMGGKVVQLVQGARKLLEFDDYEPWIERFRYFPLVQLIDLDAALGSGNNVSLVSEIVQQLPCQVGGGIRSIAGADRLLQAGAQRVIFGSALFRGNLVDQDLACSLAAGLPRESLTFAVDAKAGRLAVRGWRATLDLSPVAAMRLLEPFCSAFLYTNIETEGTMCGIATGTPQALRAATARKLYYAGGIRSWEEINRLDALGVDAVVGMAIYKEVLTV